MAKKTKAKAAAPDSKELWRQVQEKIDAGDTADPELHPDLKYHWEGVELGIADTKAKIKRQWEAAFDVEFPGWSADALRRVASLATVPADAIKPSSLFNAIHIYQAAIAQKKTPLVAVKEGKTLRFVRQSKRDDSVNEFDGTPNPPEADGPVDGSRWRHNGVLIQDKMAKGAWRLANHLFHCPDNSADYAMLAPIVSDDHSETLLDYSNCRGHRDRANVYFQRHSIPWRVDLHGKPTLKPAE